MSMAKSGELNVDGFLKYWDALMVFLGTLSPTRPTLMFYCPSSMMMSSLLEFSIIYLLSLYCL